MRFAVLAGETSGDLLGAAIIHALRSRFPEAEFYGVTGPRMREAGCESVANIDALSVMGLAEVLPKIPAIVKLRRALARRFLQDRPDCVIGVDAPDFNLPLERRLHEAGLKTAHIVSPTVWAWRAGRVKSIARSIDLLLCLFPFEPKFYADHGARLKTEFIGHPLAEELKLPIARDAARQQLNLPIQSPIVAILPGSRAGELKYLAEPFVKTAQWLAQRNPELSFVAPLAKPGLRAALEAAIEQHAPALRWHLLDGESRTAMRAADVVLLASGTATLECLLLERPMVVGYRVSAFTAWLLRSFRLLKVARVSLPNLLCAQAVVPEFLQEDAQAENFGPAIERLLTDAEACAAQLIQFSAAGAALKQDAAARAADAIARLIAA
jgi:lipid-A-disaccharide synthase